MNLYGTARVLPRPNVLLRAPLGATSPPVTGPGLARWLRWRIDVLGSAFGFRRMDASPRNALTTAAARAASTPARRRERDRRFYPPKHDRVIEQAAMAREMFRL
jgi:hypothetical protein